MEKIKQGYKQTDIGVIPEDWEVVTLDSISNLIGDGIHSTPIYSNGSEFKFINGNNLKNGAVELDVSTLSIPFSEYVRHKKQLTANTILYSINGTIGNIAFYENQKIILGKSAAYINLKQVIDKRLIFYILQSNFVLDFYENEMTGSTIRNLSLKSLRNTPIPFSNIPVEQTAIATALSDTDALIAALDKKIAKKQQIKQGAMQQLLTGKKRLPGFSGEWVEKKLGEISKSINSGKYKFESTIGSYPVYGSTGIISTSNKYEYNNIKILVARVGANAGKINLVSGKFSVTDNTLIVELLENINYSFINYLLIKKELNKFVFGSGQPLITGSQLKEIELFIPNSTEEQTAIAQILTDMDHEIAQLEKERDKYKDLKAGMMQVLLTGRVRLE